METKIQRVKRIPVIRTSRAGVEYIKYIDPLKKRLPAGFMTPTIKAGNVKEKVRGQSFPGGRYFPKPTFHVGINPKTGKQFVQTIYGKPKL